MGYLPYWRNDSSIDWDHLNVLAWFSAEIAADGTISTDHGWSGNTAQALIDDAHSVGAKVVLSATRFGGSALAPLLSSPARRATCVNALVDRMVSGGGDGIDIDFEGLLVENRGDLVAFIQELRAAMDAAQPGALLSLATPAVDWADAYDYAALAEEADVLFIMGYAYAGSWSHPQPNAPLEPSTWAWRPLSWAVDDYLQVGGSEHAHKYVLGLPLYGNRWAASSGAAGARGEHTGSVIWSTCGSLFGTHGKSWDADGATPWTAWNDGEWHQVWCEDPESLTLKMELARTQDIGGVGFWALGYDSGDPAVQDALADVLDGWYVAPGDDDDAADDDDAVDDDDAADDDDSTTAGEAGAGPVYPIERRSLSGDEGVQCAGCESRISGGGGFGGLLVLVPAVLRRERRR
jgi:spore germination protein YaaH